MYDPLKLARLVASVAVGAVAEFVGEVSASTADISAMVLIKLGRATAWLDDMAAALDPGEEYIPVVSPIFGPNDFELAGQVIQKAMAGPYRNHSHYANEPLMSESQA